ncbi:MAG: prepilin-type N-terminal cleavage/methylation domain-containing protein [Suilimivivens sp.]
MKRTREKGHRNRRLADKGFSLVEVLVCIALIALTCVPLFAGLRLSATLNNKAHYTQKVTAYAQEELETIKSVSVEDYVKSFKEGSVVDGVSYSYITSGTEWDAMNSRAQTIKGKLPTGLMTGLTQEEKDAVNAMFTPFICEKKDIDIGGKKYTLHVKFMPAEYSQYDQTTAANVNIAGFYDIAAADAVRFPVISDEINLYDETCVDSLLDRLTGLGETKTDADIMGNMKKTVLVTLVSPASSEGAESAQMSVRCDVTYSYPASSTPTAEISYCVYNGSYEVYPASGTDAGSESGGKAFVFARAFRGVNNDCINELVIDSTGDTDVYFILGRKSDADTFYNFNNIIVNGDNYSENYNIKSSLVPGEKPIPGTNGTFYCNIKVNGEQIDLDAQEKYDTIGREKYKAVGYAVEIEMFDQADSDKRVAYVEATKIDR